MNTTEYRGPEREIISGEADRAYYAHHDAARATKVPATLPALDELRQRLYRLTERVNESMHGTASMLEGHADRVHGELPKDPENRRAGMLATRDYGSGALGDIFRALEQLEGDFSHAIERLASAAGRNSNLA